MTTVASNTVDFGDHVTPEKIRDQIKALEVQKKALERALELGILPSDAEVVAISMKINDLASARKITKQQVFNALADALGLSPAAPTPAVKEEKAETKPRKKSRRSALIEGLKAKGKSGWTPSTTTEELEKMYGEAYDQDALAKLRQDFPAKK